MSRIQIDINKVRSCNEDLRRNNLKISNIARDIFLSMGSIDSRIQARRSIGSRLRKACDECNEIEQKLTQLQKFISTSMDRYEKAERKVENEAEELRALWDLRITTLMELKSNVGSLGTSSSYIEYSKMFYDGEKIGEDEDEDTEEILEETDKLLKEVNEEDDGNDWNSKPAKEDIFDKFADWITEKVTGEKASPKTQGEEVIDSQLTAMSFDEQNILADIASDYQTAFRGLGSADRINEALENFEEEPVFSSGNNTNVISKAINVEEISTLLKTDPDTAFFWSGRTNGIGGADRAAEIAKAKSGVTLESTIADKSIQMPEWDFNDPSSIKTWEDASAEYARQVSGEVRAVVGKQLREGNIWGNVELPRLKNNPNVTKITTIDPETGKETVIFER